MYGGSIDIFYHKEVKMKKIVLSIVVASIGLLGILSAEAARFNEGDTFRAIPRMPTCSQELAKKRAEVWELKGYIEELQEYIDTLEKPSTTTVSCVTDCVNNGDGTITCTLNALCANQRILQMINGSH